MRKRPQWVRRRTFTPSLKKEIVAYANTNGGTVYIGVEDDGNVIGVPNAHEVEEAVNAMIHNSIVPDLSMFAEARVEWFDDVELVVVTVHHGPEPSLLHRRQGPASGGRVRTPRNKRPTAFPRRDSSPAARGKWGRLRIGTLSQPRIEL